VTRIFSAIILLAVVLGFMFAGPEAFWVVGGAFLVSAFVEYAKLAEPKSPRAPLVLSGIATFTIYYAVAFQLPLEPVLIIATLVLAALTVGQGRPDDDVLRDIAVSIFPLFYLGLSLAVSISIRQIWGVGAMLLPLLTIIVSDSAQYYGGRLMGRRKLAPVISPKKTVEGAIAGVAAAAVAMPLLAAWLVPGHEIWASALLGVVLALAGICGDLFESLLKRSAGVKDSSNLIPGHGGVLDRIDALLFAGPVYYLFLRYAGW
jgi:phosphatidate cytidylyltransferase